MTPLERIQSHFKSTVDTMQKLADSDAPRVIAEAAHLLAERVSEGGKILLCGNGGSAADSQHIATELTSRFSPSLDRPGIAAIALTTDTSYLTARANDFGFDTVFERLIEALGRPGDSLIAISTSGESRNVVRAVERAREKDILTVGLLGGTGGALAPLVSFPIIVPDTNTQHIQEAHITIGHILCELIEETLYGSLRPPGVQTESP